MSEEKKPRSLWFYLFGCTPWTMVLLGVLFAAVMGPALINLLVLRMSPPEPQVHPLPENRLNEPRMVVNDLWAWSVDVDGDGRPDCFRQPAMGDVHLAAAGYEDGCRLGASASLLKKKLRPLEEPLRDALIALDAYKLERGWVELSVVDTDGDGSADCALEARGRGVVLRRTGATCPGDEYSLPEALESHPRVGEIEELFALEGAVRALLPAAAPE